MCAHSFPLGFKKSHQTTAKLTLPFVKIPPDFACYMVLSGFAWAVGLAMTKTIYSQCLQSDTSLFSFCALIIFI